MQAFRYRRAAQPQGPVNSDRANEFGSRVIDAIVGPAELTALGKKITRYGTVKAQTYTGAFDAGGVGHGCSADGGFSFPSDLTAHNGITIVMAYNQTARSGAQILAESSVNSNSNGGSYLLYTDTGANKFYFGNSGSGNYDAAGFPMPELGSHIVAVRIRFSGASGVVDLGAAMDGVTQALTQTNGSALVRNFGNYETYLLGRAGTTLRATATIGLYAVLSGFATDDELVRLSANPWQLFAPISRQVFIGTTAGPLIIRPAGDTTTTGWTSTGANFYDQINEVAADDANYITSPNLGASPGPYTWTITPTPLAAGTWDVRVRCSDVGGSGQVRIRFLDAGLSSVGVSAYQTVTGAFATQTHTVTTSASAVYGSIEVAP